jgi:Cu(I)/Ag(I) efflux system membrane protein CusA/SilA
VIERIIDYSARNPFVVILFMMVMVGWGVWALLNVPLDAIPDLSDVQVIIYADWPGRSPNLVEDQITYPIVTALLGAPRVRVVRGQSIFGTSFVYVIFEDGTDIYWARSRVLEYLSGIAGKLPPEVTPRIGPDATGVGWVYEYALAEKPIDVVTGKVTTRKPIPTKEGEASYSTEYEGRLYYFGSAQSLAAFKANPEAYANRRNRVPSKHNLAELRAFQDWYLKYWLQSVPGVSEVASVGGFQKQYQVTVDPNALYGYGISMDRVMMAIRSGNNDVGGGTIEFSGREYVVRGRGYVKSAADLEHIPVGADGRGRPILIKDIGTVQEGPDMRRGIADLDGEGDVVGGIVVMRFGENALNVIKRVKERIKEVEPALPEGIELITTYDRSALIGRSIATLRRTLIEESLIVSLVIIVFLLHFRSAIRAIVTLPIAVVISFIPMYYMHLTSNIMSLGGIAIAIGAMVDEAVVMIENVHKKLEHAPAEGNRKELIIEACKEIGRPMFFSLLVITVSFMPVFTLQAQEGRLFRPLAYTKTFSMASAAILSITLAPMLMVFLGGGGRIVPESQHPISRRLQRWYYPWVRALVRRRVLSVTIAAIAVLSALPLLPSTHNLLPAAIRDLKWVQRLKLGSEFMPELNEGDFLYMPVTVPGISATGARELLQVQDRIFRTVPEVDRVFGKIGRSDTSTDPAPLSMVETTIMIKPQKQWRPGMTWEKLKAEMEKAVALPGLRGALLWPIKTRIDMLTTGLRAPLGVKVFGPDIAEAERIGDEIAAVLRSHVPGTGTSYVERVTGASYIDIIPRRADAARYGLGVEEVLAIVESAVGGMNVDTAVMGRERYGINIRYYRELRDELDKLDRVLVTTPSGAHVPLAGLADIRVTTGPDMIRDENGSLSGWVLIYPTRDMGGYVADAKKAVGRYVKLPTNYYITWSGQYEYLERMRQRLLIVVPLTVFLIIVVLYFNFHSGAETAIVMLSLPFAITGSLWMLHFLNYRLSAAVWVGIIALAGLAAETGVVMIVYLDEAFHRHQREGRMNSLKDLFEAITEGAVQRVRPKIMTVMCILMGLLPLMWAHGSGADVMRRIAAPMIGGVITSTILTLEIVPAIYSFWRQRQIGSRQGG